MAAMSLAERDRVVDVVTGKVNPRGIPEMVFLEDLESTLASKRMTIEELLQNLQTMFNKYRFMETSQTDSRLRLKRKLPDIVACLECVKMLQTKKERGEVSETFFSLADQVYAQALVDPAKDRVALWLGANVMVEYSYAEAIALLDEQIVQANRKLGELAEDLAYLQAQKITTEVNMARVYNYDIKLRRLAKARDGTPAALPGGATASAT